MSGPSVTPYARKRLLSAVATQGQTWSTLQHEPKRHPVRRVGDGFEYHAAATHDDASLFRARQKKRAQRAART